MIKIKKCIIIETKYIFKPLENIVNLFFLFMKIKDIYKKFITTHSTN